MSDSEFSKDLEYKTIGLLAHVDAGKTTVCERLLFDGGTLKSFGRVDKKESFLDFLEIERQRGITVFPKQAIIRRDNQVINLIDTPGHEDFYGGVARTLPVLDIALLITDASRPITEYTKRLYFSLYEQGIPTVLFFNKMDICHFEKEELLKDAIESFETDVIDMTRPWEEVCESLAMCDEAVMEDYIENQTLEPGAVKVMFDTCQYVPAFFGSALKGEGIESLLEFIQDYTPSKTVGNNLEAKAFLITYDKGSRITHIKLTGGHLALKETVGSEKIEEIRLYNGAKYTNINEAFSGMCVGIRGISSILPVKGNTTYGKPYIMHIPKGADVKKTFDRLEKFFLQFPECDLYLEISTNTIYLNIMGPVMEAVLQVLIRDELSIEVRFEEYFSPEPMDVEVLYPEDELDYYEEDYDYEEGPKKKKSHDEADYALGLEEIEAIIKRAGGANRKTSPDMRRSHWNRYQRESASGDATATNTPKPVKPKESKDGEDYLLVDGYNCIFAWEDLTSLSADNIDSAKDALVDILSEYAHSTGKSVILVFDAYKVSGGVGSVEKIAGIDIVYTKEAQTADAYIELTSHELLKTSKVTVATSDRLEQMIVRGAGAYVLSSRDLLYEVAAARTEVMDIIKKNGNSERPLTQNLGDKINFF